MLQVADKEFLDGDGCPGLGRARGANHLALNLTILVDEIHAEIVGHALAHQLLDFGHNILRDVVQLAAGAWLNPTNVAKIANKIIQRVLAAVVMIIFKLIQRLWNLLNLNCVSDLTQDLIDQIRSALSMLEEIKSLCDPNSISFSPSEIIQTLQKSIEEAVANAADTLQGLDMKQQGKELADQLKKSANGMADAVKKAAMSKAVRAYNESKEMFDRAKALLGKGGNKTVKDMASASATLGLTGIESV